MRYQSLSKRKAHFKTFTGLLVEEFDYRPNPATFAKQIPAAFPRSPKAKRQKENYLVGRNEKGVS